MALSIIIARIDIKGPPRCFCLGCDRIGEFHMATGAVSAGSLYGSVVVWPGRFAARTRSVEPARAASEISLSRQAGSLLRVGLDGEYAPKKGKGLPSASPSRLTQCTVVD